MKWIRAVFSFIGTTIMGMFGGQKEKGVRRYGIPGLAVTLSGVAALPMLFLVPVLCMGYGENSWLMGLIRNDTLVRMVYSSILSLPFLFYGRKRWACALVVLVGAFSVRAGSLGHVGWFGDILVEDIFRYGSLGLLITYNLFF